MANVSGSIIGIVMKEAVRRAITVIRNERFLFEVEEKTGYDGISADVVTSADRAAQEVYLKVIRECFPGYGIICEEDRLRVECIQSEKAYFMIDPLCGTKAYIRQKSSGIGTMIALVEGSRVTAAFVGDIMTLEVYGYRPDSDKVHRISEFEKARELRIDTQRSLQDQFIDLRMMPHNFSEMIQAMSLPVEKGGLFKDAGTSDGSIGISMAKPWKGEVGAAVWPIRSDTPWDMAPVVGISKKLDFTFFKIFPSIAEMIKFDPEIPMEVQKRDYEILVVHESREEEVLSWYRNWKIHNYYT